MCFVVASFAGASIIERDEIEAKAKEFDIHHANVERDYVFGWLLKSIFENEYLRTRLIFKGGNCLRKAYYPQTRFSSDLDFSTTSAVDVESVSNEINNACRAAEAACGVEFIVDRNTFVAGLFIDSERRSYKGRVYFTDFFGNQDDSESNYKEIANQRGSYKAASSEERHTAPPLPFF